MKILKSRWITLTLLFLSMGLLSYLANYHLRGARLDLTEERIYTLSEGTKNILKSVGIPITIKLYYSKTAASKGAEGMRQFNNYFYYISDLLREYASLSGNHLKLEVIDPRPDTDDEADAELYNLKRFQLTDQESYFFGMVAKTATGGESIIPFFNPGDQSNLEYQLTKSIYTLLHPIKKKIGIISDTGFNSDGLSPFIMQITGGKMRSPTQSWIMNEMLKDFYEVKNIPLESEIIDPVDLLLVINPNEAVSDKLKKAVDKYLYQGGKMALFVDPQFVADAQKREQRSFSTWDKFFSSWGVDFNKDRAAADLNYVGVAKVDQYSPPTRLLPLLNCQEGCFNFSQESLTSNLKNMLFVYPGFFKLKERNENNKNLVFTPLIQTSNRAGTYPISEKHFKDPSVLTRDFTKEENPLVLSYRVEGKFPASFLSAEETSKLQHKNSFVTMVSDTDVLFDQFSFQKNAMGIIPTNQNSVFFLNLVEEMVGSKELTSIRSKKSIIRTFERVDVIEKRSLEKTAEKLKEIEMSIEKTQKELNELAQKSGDFNIALIAKESLVKKKGLALKLKNDKRELREVKRKGREEVEQLGLKIQLINILVAPFLLFFLASFIFWRRRRLSDKKEVLFHKEVMCD